MKVLMVSSPGGHLTQAFALQTWWEQHDRMWVSAPTIDVTSRLHGERLVFGHHPTVRNVPNLLRNWFLAGRVLDEYEPDLVFSTGAGVAVPFILQAKRRRIATAFLEPIDRLDKPSLSGRLVYPFTDVHMVQWDEVRAAIPSSAFVGLVVG